MDEIRELYLWPARVCENCNINNLSRDDRTNAIEVAQSIVHNPELKPIYGQYLLRLVVSGEINASQSSAIVDCIATNRCKVF